MSASISRNLKAKKKFFLKGKRKWRENAKIEKKMAAAAIDAIFCWFVCLFVFFKTLRSSLRRRHRRNRIKEYLFFLSFTFFFACVRLRFHAAKDKWSRRGAIERPNKSKKRRAATPSRSAPMKRYRRVVDADVHVDVVDVVDVVDATRNGRKRTKYDDEIEQSVADDVDAVIVVVADVVAVVFFWRRGSVGKRKARKSTPKTKKKGPRFHAERKRNAARGRSINK